MTPPTGRVMTREQPWQFPRRQKLRLAEAVFHWCLIGCFHRPIYDRDLLKDRNRDRRFLCSTNHTNASARADEQSAAYNNTQQKCTYITKHAANSRSSSPTRGRLLRFYPSLSGLLDKPWSQVSSFLPPPASASIFIAHGVGYSHCSPIFLRHVYCQYDT